MKNYLRYALSTVLILSACPAIAEDSGVDTSTIEQRRAAEAARRAIKKTSRVPDLSPVVFDYNKYVATKDIIYTAAGAHNLIRRLRQEQVVLADYKTVIDDYEDLLARYESNRTCNITQLEPYYKNPETAWDKIAEEAYNAEKLVSTAVAGDISKSEAAAVALARWNIGYKFLNRMYSSQEVYGSVKKDFPLWADQKYNYDNEYKAKYASLANALKVAGGADELVALLNNGPAVSDNVKYSASRYNELVLAHNDLISKVFGKNIPNGLDVSAPSTAPVGLPPWKEMIYSTEWEKDVVVGAVSLYPAIPEPWTVYVDSGFKKFNSEGEMAKILSVVGYIGDYAKIKMNGTVLPLNKNRIERYLLLRTAEEERRPIAAQLKLVFDKKQAELKSLVKAQGITLDEGVDFSNLDDVNAVAELIKEQKQTNIELGKKGIEAIENLYNNSQDRGTMDERLAASIAKAKTMVDALKTDVDGLTTINNNTAINVDDNLRTENANQALIDQYKKISDENKSELMSNQSSWCPIY